MHKLNQVHFVMQICLM